MIPGARTAAQAVREIVGRAPANGLSAIPVHKFSVHDGCLRQIPHRIALHKIKARSGGKWLQERHTERALKTFLACALSHLPQLDRFISLAHCS